MLVHHSMSVQASRNCIKSWSMWNYSSHEHNEFNCLYVCTFAYNKEDIMCTCLHDRKLDRQTDTHTHKDGKSCKDVHMCARTYAREDSQDSLRSPARKTFENILVAQTSSRSLVIWNMSIAWEWGSVFVVPLSSEKSFDMFIIPFGITVPRFYN